MGDLMLARRDSDSGVSWIMGSITIAAWIAKLAFIALLALGIAYDEIGPRGAAVFLVLGAGAWFGLPRVGGEALVTSVLAVVDIALVFVVFKGDVRLGPRG